MGLTYYAICDEKKLYCYIGKITELDADFGPEFPYLETFQIFLLETIGEYIHLSSCFDPYESDYEEIKYDGRWN